ncbi:hypothetical protein EI555_003641, partial [Monodon monoceros]
VRVTVLADNEPSSQFHYLIEVSTGYRRRAATTANVSEINVPHLLLGVFCHVRDKPKESRYNFLYRIFHCHVLGGYHPLWIRGAERTPIIFVIPRKQSLNEGDWMSSSWALRLLCGNYTACSSGMTVLTSALLGKYLYQAGMLLLLCGSLAFWGKTCVALR